MATKKLYKDTSNKMISGVCSGIAKYFDIDPTIIRLLWVAAIVFGGTGILAYIICAIVIPDEPDGYTEVDYTEVDKD